MLIYKLICCVYMDTGDSSLEKKAFAYVCIMDHEKSLHVFPLLSTTMRMRLVFGSESKVQGVAPACAPGRGLGVIHREFQQQKGWVMLGYALLGKSP